MSIHPQFDNAQPVTELDYPIVLRFAGLHPNDLGRFGMHDKRQGGDLSHVDATLSDLNEEFLAGPKWKDVIQAEVREARQNNLSEHLRALTANSRKKEARTVETAGLVDPWQRSKGGPLREGILTVSKEWFGGTGHDGWDPKKVARFRKAAMTFLKRHFPDGQLRYASAHADEEAYHIHFVVAVWRERITANRGRQILLQASMNPLLSRYEHAQDLAGEAFADLGIIRGERRAEARRIAKAAGAPLPEKRLHVPPSEWRAEQIAQGTAKAEQVVTKAQHEADTVVAEAQSLATATIRKSRKRAIRDAKARKEKAAREVSAAERQCDIATRETDRLASGIETARQMKDEARIQLNEVQQEADRVALAVEVGKDELQTITTTRDEVLGAVRQMQQDLSYAETRRDKAEHEEQDARESVAEIEEKATELTMAIDAAKDELRLITGQSETGREKAAAAWAAAEQAGAEKERVEAELVTARRKRRAEEDLLASLMTSVTAARKEVSIAEAMAQALLEGMEMFAQGVFRWMQTQADRKPKLVWSEAAPKDAGARRELVGRIRPAMPMIERLAGTVADAVQELLATERGKLAKDAAFVLGLRDDWTNQQRSELHRIGDAET